jgi:hypothetical protein
MKTNLLSNLDPLLFADEVIKKSLLLSSHNKKQSTIFRIWQTLFSKLESKEASFLALGKECHLLFDRVEKIPTLFKANQAKLFDQNASYQTYLKAAHLVITLLATSKSAKVEQQLLPLMQKVAGFRYRIETCNGGLDRSQIDPVLTQNMMSAALNWKKEHSLIIKKELTSQEIKKLEEASTYPQFVEVMLSRRSLQEAFFNWALRDNCGVSQFIEFPATSARIKRAFLACRIGRLRESMFRIEKREKEGCTEKVISLPFFIHKKIEYINILDESQEVELTGWKLTIREVLNIFSEKNKTIGNLEFFGSTGITNWNGHELGTWNPATNAYYHIDLTKEEWWKDLPVLEEVSKEHLIERLHENIEEGEWVICAKAARTTPDLDLDGRHGYLEIAIPTDQGTYQIYPFGAFAADFPNTDWELVKFITNTVKGKICYPDENFFYSHRQQATYAMRVLAEKGFAFMKVIQKELIKAFYGHFIFQFGAENCAFWAQKVLHTIDSKRHNFYKLDIVKSNPLNPVLNKIFNFFRCLPLHKRTHAVKTVDTLLGSYRGIVIFENHEKVYKKHNTSAVRNELTIYQPGYLHEQIEKKELKGVITTGNC